MIADVLDLSCSLEGCPVQPGVCEPLDELRQTLDQLPAILTQVCATYGGRGILWRNQAAATAIAARNAFQHPYNHTPPPIGHLMHTPLHSVTGRENLSAWPKPHTPTPKQALHTANFAFCEMHCILEGSLHLLLQVDHTHQVKHTNRAVLVKQVRQTSRAISPGGQGGNTNSKQQGPSSRWLKFYH